MGVVRKDPKWQNEPEKLLKSERVAKEKRVLIVGIYGSPRKGGNTDVMLDAFLEGAKAAGGESRRIYVRDLEIKGCLGCGHCDRTGVCIQKDAMQQVYPLLEEARRIVVASPIYFYGVTAQLKLLIDRAQALFMKREIAKKEGKNPVEAPLRRGFLLLAGATRGKRLFECSILTIRYFYDALGVNCAGELSFREVDERGAILRNPQAVAACRQAGKEFISGP